MWFCMATAPFPQRHVLHTKLLHSLYLSKGTSVNAYMSSDANGGSTYLSGNQEAGIITSSETQFLTDRMMGTRTKLVNFSGLAI